MQVPIEWLPERGHAEQLILLLHGQGQTGAEMAPLAQALRATFPQAAVLAPDAPHADGSAIGRRWFAAHHPAGNLPAADDVAQALASLQRWVQAQQKRLGVGAAATALGGLGHGAMLALALALQHDGIAGRVLAFAGAFAAPPQAAPRHTTLHLFHGEADEVMPVEGARKALRQLAELQGDATLDTAAGVGHALHPALVDCALQRLQTHIPLRTWQAALGAAQPLHI
ncbi:MAG: esterase [Rubrivivax sp.]|nr:esterase [Rubrivivax sp.]